MSASPAAALVAEFGELATLTAAVRRLRAEGFTRFEVYGPAPLDELDVLVPTRRGRSVTAIMVTAAVFGACVGSFIQYWGSVLDYPLNVGGRPFNGWPGFVPSAWEVCALFTVYAGFFAFLALCRLPRLHHPIFSAQNFERVTQDRFFVCVEASTEPWDEALARRVLNEQGALSLTELEA